MQVRDLTIHISCTHERWQHLADSLRDASSQLSHVSCPPLPHLPPIALCFGLTDLHTGVVMHIPDRRFAFSIDGNQSNDCNVLPSSLVLDANKVLASVSCVNRACRDFIQAWTRISSVLRDTFQDVFMPLYTFGTTIMKQVASGLHNMSSIPPASIALHDIRDQYHIPRAWRSQHLVIRHHAQTRQYRFHRRQDK